MSKQGFNLLRPQIEPPSMWTKVYDYIIGSARLIIIIVELIVVGAFVVRIFTDIESNNLNEQIKTKEAILASFSEAEQRYVNIQSKSSAYEKIWEESYKYSTLFSEVNSYLPVSAQEYGVRFNEKTVFLNGKAPLREVSEMESKFKQSNTFSRQELDQIQTEGSNTNVLGTFSFRADIENMDKKVISQ